MKNDSKLFSNQNPLLSALETILHKFFDGKTYEYTGKELKMKNEECDFGGCLCDRGGNRGKTVLIKREIDPEPRFACKRAVNRFKRMKISFKTIDFLKIP